MIAATRGTHADIARKKPAAPRKRCLDAEQRSSGSVGGGKHGFEFRSPQGVALADTEVNCSIDGAVLLSAHARWKQSLSAE
jgi:hypothetical protein